MKFTNVLAMLAAVAVAAFAAEGSYSGTKTVAADRMMAFTFGDRDWSADVRCTTACDAYALNSSGLSWIQTRFQEIDEPLEVEGESTDNKVYGPITNSSTDVPPESQVVKKTVGGTSLSVSFGAHGTDSMLVMDNSNLFGTSATGTNTFEWSGKVSLSASDIIGIIAGALGGVVGFILAGWICVWFWKYDGCKKTAKACNSLCGCICATGCCHSIYSFFCCCCPGAGKKKKDSKKKDYDL